MRRVLDKLGWVLAALVSLLVLASIAGIAHGGPLDPPGTPGPTDGVRLPGTPISSIPYTISQPGYYYVTRNLSQTQSGQDGIDINASGVTLDLGGFTLDGAGIGRDGVLVQNPPAPYDVTIRNGSASHWTQFGIDATSSSVEHVRASFNNEGIRVISGTLSDCMAEENTTFGIEITFGTLTNCTAVGNATGIHAYTAAVQSCHTQAFTTGVLAEQGSTVRDCTDQQSSVGIDATTSVVEGCSLEFEHYGIVVHTNADVHGNTVSSTSSDGIRLSGGGNSLVTDNSVYHAGQSGGSGIYAETNYNRIARNNVSDTIGPGIQVVSSFNTIDENSVFHNSDPGILVTGLKNTVVRNSALSNDSPVTNYSIVAGNNDGPVNAASSSSNPWSNTQ